MSTQRGHEMRKFLIAINVLVVLLIVVVIVYTTIDSIRRIDQEMQKEEQRVTLQFVDYIKTALTEAADLVASGSGAMEEINPDLTAGADLATALKLLQALTEVQRAQYAADYMTYVSGGMVLASSTKEGVDISDFPTKMPADGYEFLDELGGRQGTFISVFMDTEISPLAEDEFTNVAFDRTEEFAAMEDYYANEKSDLVTRQVIIGIIAVIAALLLTTFGAYYLTRRYITAPISELTEASHRIMDGSFEGQVEVVEESDYADIQRLLQSGQVLMEKMEESQSED